MNDTPTEQPDVTPPAALTLRNEPEANVARYGLRRSTPEPWYAGPLGPKRGAS